MIPGPSARRGNQVALVALTGLIVLFICALWQGLNKRRNLEKYGILVKAAISYKQYQKGIEKFTVNFKYNGHYYYNTFQSEKLDRKLGDSIIIKINAQDPADYCVLAADSSQ